MKVISSFNLCMALFTVQYRQCILGLFFQVPARPNYSLVLYYAADRPIKENSLLGRFVDGTDAFRDSRFKLIPSIIEVTQVVTN